MRKAILMLGLLAALAFAGAASAGVVQPPKPKPLMLCGSCGGNGGGFTGCSTVSASHSASVSFLANINHYLVVSYCKSYGIITSVSIAAHGCDTSGFVSCSPGPAWQTGGGVGSTSASFEAHAGWNVTVTPFFNSTDVLTLQVPAG